MATLVAGLTNEDLSISDEATSMAHESHHHDIEPPGKFEVPKGFVTTAIVFIVLGLAAFLFGLFSDNEARAWRGYVIGFWFTFSLALSGPFFIATQYLSKAGWSVSIRRIPEAMGTFLIPSVVLGAIALFGADHLFGWIDLAPEVFDPESELYDPIVAAKEAVLSETVLIFVTVGATAALAIMYAIMRKFSLQQDEEGGYELMHKNIWVSAIFIIVFVISVSVMSWYWTMSYDPHWYSMMWSVYAFAGLFQTGLAVMILVLLYMMSKKLFGDCVGTEQVHRMGQLLFGFTVFYAYIHFSQFLLLWYANIPETAKWYTDRMSEGWGIYLLLIPIFKFAIPFFALLRQKAKKNHKNILVYVCILLVGMQALEIWMWVMPYIYGVGLMAPMVPTFEILITLGFVGLFMIVVAKSLARHNLVPLKDPLLHEAVPHSHDHLIYPNGKPGESGQDDDE